MKCPHCNIEIFYHPSWDYIGTDTDGDWVLVKAKCPSCEKYISRLLNGLNIKNRVTGNKSFSNLEKNFLAYPKGSSRPPCPSEVPPEFAEDYSEACLVIADSPKASAALSRRCLQNLLREKAEVEHSNLSKEIQEVIDSKALPSYIAEIIDAVRNIGNFAAHPIKSEKTGEIVSVEPEEAELNLDVIEALFDFYFVRPTIIKKKKSALNKKLEDAGKDPIK